MESWSSRKMISHSENIGNSSHQENVPPSITRKTRGGSKNYPKSYPSSCSETMNNAEENAHSNAWISLGRQHQVISEG